MPNTRTQVQSILPYFQRGCRASRNSAVGKSKEHRQEHRQEAHYECQPKYPEKMLSQRWKKTNIRRWRRGLCSLEKDNGILPDSPGRIDREYTELTFTCHQKNRRPPLPKCPLLPVSPNELHQKNAPRPSHATTETTTTRQPSPPSKPREQ